MSDDDHNAAQLTGDLPPVTALVTADRAIAPGDRQLMATELPLGPPNKTVHRLVGVAVGIPAGLGIALSPHGLLLGISGAAFLSYLVGWTVFVVSRMNRFSTENNLALRALGRGELATAQEVFIRWASSPVTAISALARHNLGWTLMLEGRVEEAARLLEDTAEHHRRALLRISTLPTTLLDTALCHALLGNLDLAESWYAKAEQPVKAPPRPALPGTRALVRAVIDCRKGRAAEASVSLEHAWTEHETVMTGETLRMMRVVRAFACAAADGPRNQGLVERVLGDMKPRYEHELAFLGGTWPEMAAFLAAHQLAG
jgi:hypothetical protein